MEVSHLELKGPVCSFWVEIVIRREEPEKSSAPLEALFWLFLSYIGLDY